MSQVSNSSVKLLRMPAVVAITGISEGSVYRFGQGKEVPATGTCCGTKDDRLAVRYNRPVGAGSVIGRPGRLTPSLLDLLLDPLFNI